MAKLTAKGRNRLRKTSFAIPPKKGKKGKYPVHDLAHAKNAMSRVSQHGSAKEKAAVRRAVKRKFPALAKRSKFIRRAKGRK